MHVFRIFYVIQKCNNCVNWEKTYFVLFRTLPRVGHHFRKSHHRHWGPLCIKVASTTSVSISSWRVYIILSREPGCCKEPACQCRSYKRLGFSLWVGKIPWRRSWELTPVFLPEESHGQRNLVSYSLIGSLRVRHNWSNLACTCASRETIFDDFIMASGRAIITLKSIIRIISSLHFRLHWNYFWRYIIQEDQLGIEKVL